MIGVILCIILTIIIIGIGILAIKIDDNKKWGIIYLVSGKDKITTYIIMALIFII